MVSNSTVILFSGFLHSVRLFTIRRKLSCTYGETHDRSRDHGEQSNSRAVIGQTSVPGYHSLSATA